MLEQLIVVSITYYYFLIFAFYVNLSPLFSIEIILSKEK